MTVHPCAVAINQPMLILGIERKMLGLSVMISVLVGANGSRVVGAVLFVAILALAKKLTRRDDRLIQIAPFLWRQAAHYDPIKRSVFELIIVEERTEEE